MAQHDMMECDNFLPPACSTPGVGGSINNVVHTVATGATIVPAVQVSQTVDCVTTGTETTMGNVTEVANTCESFSVVGALRTNAYEVNEGNECEDTEWSTNGTDTCAFNEAYATCCPCKVEAKPMRALPWGQFSDARGMDKSEAFCDRFHEGKDCQDPVKDIESRINRQVDQVLSDILS